MSQTDSVIRLPLLVVVPGSSHSVCVCVCYYIDYRFKCDEIECDAVFGAVRSIVVIVDVDFVIEFV